MRNQINIKKRSAIYIISTFLLFGLSGFELAWAQEDILTLDDALRMSVTRGSVQKQYEYARDAAQQGIQVQKADYLPTFQFRTSVSHANEAPRIPVEFKNDTVLARQGTRNTFISRFELNQVIYDFGKTRNNVSAARYQAQSVDAEFDQKKFALRNEVRQQFYNSLYYQNVDSIYDEVIPYSRELAQINEERMKNGVALSPEVLKAQVDLQQMEAQRASAESGYRKALVQLAYLTGQEDTRFNTIGKLPDLPAQTDMSIYYNELYQRALRYRSDIDQLEFKSKQQEATAKSIEALKYPTLMLQSDFSYFGPDAFGYYSGLSSRGLNPVNWRVGVGFTYTIFDGSRIRSRKNQLLALKAQFQEQANQLEQQIGTQIKTLLKDLENLRILEQNNKMLIEQIDANIALVKASYDNGNVPRIEYIKAIIPRASARAALQNTRSDIAQVLVELERAVGTDISDLW